MFQLTTLGQDLTDTVSADPRAVLKAPLGAALRSEIEKALGSGSYVGAETLLVDEIKRNPKSPRLLTVLGQVFFLDGKYVNCAVALKKAEALAPLDDQNRFTLAMSYVRIERHDWARLELQRLVRNDPGKALYPYWLGRLDYADLQLNSAAINFQKALELDSEFTRAHDNLGLCYEALGKHEEAGQSYEEANRLNRLNTPSSPWPPFNWGSLLLKLGRLGEAESCFRESLRYDTEFAKSHYQLGVVLEKQQKEAEAIQELQRACILDPKYAEPHYVLSRMYRRRGEEQKAQSALATFRKLKKDKRLEQLQ